MFDEFDEEVVMEQKAEDVVLTRPIYRESLERLRAMLDEGKPIVTVHRNVAAMLDDLVRLAPVYREATTGGIKVVPEPDGTWRAWLTPDVQVVGSRDAVSTEVHVAMAATDRERGKTSPMVGGYRVIDRRHGADMAEPGTDATRVTVAVSRMTFEDEAKLREELRLARKATETWASACAEARQEVERLKHVERENNRKITNLRNERNQARADAGHLPIESCEQRPLAAATSEILRLKSENDCLRTTARNNEPYVRRQDEELAELRRRLAAQDEAFAGLQREFDKVSLERDQLAEEGEWVHKVNEWLVYIKQSLDRVEVAVKPKTPLWRRLFRGDR